MKLSKTHLTAEVPHPNDPDFIVTVRRLGKRALLNLVKVAQAMQKRRLLKDGDEIVRGADGQPVFVEEQDLDIDVVLANLKQIVAGWRGITDEDDAPVAFSVEAIEEVLINRAPDVVTIDPETKTEKREWFSAYLIGKALDPKTFDPDPLG